MLEFFNLRSKRIRNLSRRFSTRKTNLSIKPVLLPIVFPLVFLTVGQLHSFDPLSLISSTWVKRAAPTLSRKNLRIFVKGNLPRLRMHLIEPAKSIHVNWPLEGSDRPEKLRQLHDGIGCKVVHPKSEAGQNLRESGVQRKPQPSSKKNPETPCTLHREGRE